MDINQTEHPTMSNKEFLAGLLIITAPFIALFIKACF